MVEYCFICYIQLQYILCCYASYVTLHYMNFSLLSSLLHFIIRFIITLLFIYYYYYYYHNNNDNIYVYIFFSLVLYDDDSSDDIKYSHLLFIFRLVNLYLWV